MSTTQGTEPGDELQPETEPETEPEADDETEPGDETDPDDGGDTFPRAYVENLRGESKRYRERAQSAESRAGELSAALWRAQVAGLDRLADPEDLPMPEDGDPLDPEAITAAVDDLLQRKPHLAARRARGDLGQHERGDAADGVSLAALMRANT